MMLTASDDPLAQLRTDLQTHAGFGDKFSGGPGDRATADWIAQELSAAGYAVNGEAITVPRFDPARVTLIADDDTFEIFPEPLVVTTPEAGITAPLEVIHDAAQAPRTRGKIAVIAAPYGHHVVLWLPPIGDMLKRVHEEGALAAIILPTGPSGEIVALNAPADRPFVPMPIAIARPADLSRFIRHAERGTCARLTVTGAAQRIQSPNIFGELRRGPRWIVLSTPRTGFFTCATERGTGTAAFLALARRSVTEYPDHSLFVLNTTGHELRSAGTHDALAKAPHPQQTDVWAHIGATLAAYDQLEIGEQRRLDLADPNRFSRVTTALMEPARRAFAGLSGLDTPQLVGPGPGEIGSIVAHGYERAFAVFGQSHWFHTRFDTADKTSAELLHPVVEAHARLIAEAVRAARA